MAKGGYKGSSPARETSPEEYSGVWDIVEQYGEQKAGSWPFQADDCAPKSLRFNASDSAYLSRTPTAAGNKRVFTFSCWVKRTNISGVYPRMFGTYNGGSYIGWDIEFNNSDQIDIHYYNGSSYVVRRTTNAVYRDPSAWYSVVVAVDLNISGNDQVKLFVNGEQVTSFATITNANINTNIGDVENRIGYNYSYSDFWLSDVHFIDGQALSCEEFGFFDGQGIWQPKRFTGDYSSGTVWSNYLTASNGGFHAAPYNEPAGFNGFVGSSSGGYVQTANGTANPNSLTFTPPTGIPYNDKVEVWLINSANTVSVNGGTAQSIAGTQWVQVATGPGTLTSIKFERPSTNGASFGGIRIDGVDLVDPAVGRNSFHLEFEASADRLAKDTSGLRNHWTANNVHIPSAETATYYTTSTLYHTLADVLANGTNRGQSAFTLSASEYVYIVIGKGGADGQLAHGSGATWPLGYVYANLSPASGYEWTYTGGYGSTEAALQYWRNEGTAANGNENAYTYAADIPMYLLANDRNSVGGSAGYQPTTNGTSAFANGTSFPALVNTTNNNPITGDSSVDSPVNGNEASTGAGSERRGNYCVLNPFDRQSTNGTLSNGNLDLTQTGSTWAMYRGTIFVSSGKWYWECTLGNNQYSTIGICTDVYQMASSTGIWVNGSTEFFGYYPYNGYKYNGGSGASYTTADTTASGSVIGVALDMDNGTLAFYKDGTSLGTAFTGLTGKNVSPTHWLYAQSNADSYNFGQFRFSHNAPAGYSPLATSFLPEPTIKRGDEAMDAALWTGNGATQTIENFRISPDLVWIKRRNSNGDHQLYDTVRGVNKGLSTNLTDMQWEYAGGLSSFNSDGFTIGSLGGANGNGDTHVGWVWDAGESTTTISPGDLNSSAYDQSQTWSTSGTLSNFTTTGTYDFAHLFNGVLGTDTPGTDNQMTSPSGGSGTWTYTINNVTEFKIRLYVPGSTHATANSIKINGSDIVQAQILDKGLTNDAWHTVTVPGITTFSSLFVEDNYWYVSNIYINGKELVDAINDSQTWSNGLTGLTNSTITNPTRAFNGDPDNYADSTAGFTVDLSGHTFGTGAHTIEVLSGGATSFSVNGSTNLTDPGGGGAKVWTGTHTGELTSLTSSATGASIYYLKIDGKFLVDTGGNIAPAIPSTAADLRARPDAGFSIAFWQAQASAVTVPHGLSKPHFIIMKSRNNNSSPWLIYHKDLGSSHYLDFHSAAPTSNNLVFTDEPTSVVFSPGNGIVNSSVYGQMIAYCWSEVNDYSKFTSFTGSGGDVFVYLGFKPRVIWFKNANAGANWLCYDTARNPSNPANFSFQLDEPNTDTAVNNDDIDILCNGFNVKATRADLTGSGNKILIAAWAENPFASNNRAV